MVLAKVIGATFICGFAAIVAISAWNFLQDGPDSNRLTSILICALVVLLGLFSAWQRRKPKG